MGWGQGEGGTLRDSTPEEALIISPLHLLPLSQTHGLARLSRADGEGEE